MSKILNWHVYTYSDNVGVTFFPVEARSFSEACEAAENSCMSAETVVAIRRVDLIPHIDSALSFVSGEKKTETKQPELF